MTRVRVALKERSYDILVGKGALGSLGKEALRLKLGDSAYIITNPLIKRLHGKKVEEDLKRSKIDYRFRLIPDSEKSKSLTQAYRLIEELTRYDKKRKVFIVALGGGVVGDLSGFVASIYKRGIPYVQVPTTLLGQVDSAIGGKTAVDLKTGKNLVGAIYQPKLVCSDTGLLKTLSRRQLQAGLAEVIKYGIIKDPAFFRYLEKNYRNVLGLKSPAIEKIVATCSRIKAGYVSADEKENKGIRTELNFGHTLGHAIEAAGNYSGYNHGEAVALGMLIAADISRKVGLASERDVKRIGSLIKKAGLPVKIKRGLALKKIIAAYYRDKKFRGRKNRLVLIRSIGKAVVREGIPLGLIKGYLL